MLLFDRLCIDCACVYFFCVTYGLVHAFILRRFGKGLLVVLSPCARRFSLPCKVAISQRKLIAGVYQFTITDLPESYIYMSQAQEQGVSFAMLYLFYSRPVQYARRVRIDARHTREYDHAYLGCLLSSPKLLRLVPVPP